MYIVQCVQLEILVYSSNVLISLFRVRYLQNNIQINHLFLKNPLFTVENDLQWKTWRKKTPIKIQFYLQQVKNDMIEDVILAFWPHFPPKCVKILLFLGVFKKNRFPERKTTSNQKNEEKRPPLKFNFT